MKYLKVILNRNSVYLLMLTIAMISLLSGCMSKDEKQKAEEKEIIAKEYLEQYLEKNYKDAEVLTIETCTRQTIGAFSPPETYATDLVCLTYIENEEQYHIIYDIEKQIYYEDRDCEILTNQLIEYVNSQTDLFCPEELVITYSPKNTKADMTGYYVAGENFLEAILNERYSFHVVANYEEAKEELSQIDLSAFCEEVNITFILTDYVSGRYGLISADNTPYALNQRRMDEYSCADAESNSTYSAYERTIENDIEIVWPKDIVSITTDVSEAEQSVVTSYYSGATFTSVDGEIVNVTIESMTEDFAGTRIYFFFPKEQKNAYTIVSNDEIDNPDIKKLEWHENGKMYFWYSIPYELRGQPSTTISIGYYEK